MLLNLITLTSNDFICSPILLIFWQIMCISKIYKKNNKCCGIMCQIIPEWLQQWTMTEQKQVIQLSSWKYIFFQALAEWDWVSCKGKICVVQYNKEITTTILLSQYMCKDFVYTTFVNTGNKLIFLQLCKCLHYDIFMC